jgi:hypothetical protein
MNNNKIIMYYLPAIGAGNVAFAVDGGAVKSACLHTYKQSTEKKKFNRELYQKNRNSKQYTQQQKKHNFKNIVKFF